MKKILRVLGILLGIIVVAVAALLIYVKTALPKVSAAPNITVELTPERVKHGEYLANHVTVCIDCHSQRDYTTWSAPLVKGTEGQGGEAFTQDFGFPGKFYAKNLTPLNLASYTDGELFRTITTGVNKHGKALFPIMPWQNYSKMDPEDIKDIIAYLRTLKPIKNEVAESEADFPMNFILNTMPKDADPGKKPATTDMAAYGAYVFNAAGCGECHTKQEKGKIVGEPLAGGFEFKFPGGAVLRSANITPDNSTGIGQWSEAAFLAKFKAYADSSYRPHKVAPGEKQTLMPWSMYSGMDSTDLKAIYAYLRTAKPVNNKVEIWQAGGK